MKRFDGSEIPKSYFFSSVFVDNEATLITFKFPSMTLLPNIELLVNKFYPSRLFIDLMTCLRSPLSIS